MWKRGPAPRPPPFPQVRRTGATSLVCVLMALVVGVGAIICAAVSVPNAVDQLKAGTGIGFASFCAT